MFHHLTSRRLWLTAAAVTALGVTTAISTTGLSPSMAQAPADDGIKVGLFNFDQVFQVYPGRDEAQQRFQELEAQAQQAQQGQDQQAFMQAYQEMQQIQEQLFADFQTDLAAVMEEVVAETGAQIVAIDIDAVDTLAYTADNVETEDVTNLVIREITDGELEEAPQQPMMPGMDQQQQQQQQQQQDQEEAPDFGF